MGERTGVWHYYSFNGVLETIEDSYNDGQLNGTRTEYFPNGKKKEIYTYKDNVLKSETVFDLAGNVIMKDDSTSESFVDKDYFANGVLQLEGGIKNGKRNGVWRFYNPNGILTGENTYVDDDQSGPQKTYYSNGKINTVYYCDSNKTNGLYKEYYKDGQLKSQSWFINNLQQGRYYNYYKNGKIHSTGYLDAGKNVGTINYFYSNGNPDMMHYEYALVYNNYAGASRIYSWSKSAKFFYDNVYNLNSKEEKAVSSFFKTIEINKLNDEVTIRSIEAKVKTEIAVSNDIDKDLTLDDIVKQKRASSRGVTKLLIALYQKAGIKVEMVLTSDRTARPFDPTFNCMFSQETYIDRRNKLRKKFKSGLLLFLGNTEAPMNYPGNTYKYRQDSNFLYFFGIDHPGLAAVMDIEAGTDCIYGDDYTMSLSTSSIRQMMTPMAFQKI